MNKNYLKTILSLAVMVLVFSGCQKVVNNTVVQPPVVDNGNEDRVATSTEDGGDEVASSSDVSGIEIATTSNKYEIKFLETNINTSNWEVYTNNEHGFKIKYPNKWYWEDYTSDFKHLTIGFYPPEKKRGWEYFGTFAISAIKNEKYKNIIDYYSELKLIENYDYRFELVENKNKQKIVLEYNLPAVSPIDSARLLCNGYIVVIDSFAYSNRKEFEVMINEFNCFR